MHARIDRPQGAIRARRARRGPGRVPVAIIGALLAVTAACGDGSSSAPSTSQGASTSQGPATSGSPSTTSGQPATAGGAQDENVSYDNLQRHYLLYVPASIDASTPAPLVFVLHGNGKDAAGYEADTGFDDEAENHGFIAVYPDAVDGVWNGGFSQKNTDVDDVGFLRSLIDTVDKVHPVDRSRVYSTGHSGGGMMSYRFACDAPDVLAAVAPVSATLMVDCNPGTPVPVFHIHGLADPSLPFNGRADRGFPPVNDVIDQWVGFDGCSGDSTESTDGPVTTTLWDSCREHTAVELLTIDGWGHDYPGPSAGAPIDATDLIWQFFVDHSRQG